MSVIQWKSSSEYAMINFVNIIEFSGWYFEGTRTVQTKPDPDAKFTWHRNSHSIFIYVTVASVFCCVKSVVFQHQLMLYYNIIQLFDEIINIIYSQCSIKLFFYEIISHSYHSDICLLSPLLKSCQMPLLVQVEKSKM